PFVCSRESGTSRSCLRMTRFQISRRATSARPCIAIDSQRRTSTDKLARGGNARNSGNTCRQSLSKTYVRIDKRPSRLSKVRRRGMFGPVPKEGQIVTEGTVTQVLPGTMFRVDLPGQRNVLAHIFGN